MANQTPNLKVRYEFDKSGRNPNNLVSNEQHTTTQRIRKVITVISTMIQLFLLI